MVHVDSSRVSLCNSGLIQRNEGQLPAWQAFEREGKGSFRPVVSRPNSLLLPFRTPATQARRSIKKCMHKIENTDAFTNLFKFFPSLTNEPICLFFQWNPLRNYILTGNRVRVKSSGLTPGFANARPLPPGTNRAGKCPAVATSPRGKGRGGAAGMD